MAIRQRKMIIKKNKLNIFTHIKCTYAVVSFVKALHFIWSRNILLLNKCTKSIFLNFNFTQKKYGGYNFDYVTLHSHIEVAAIILL